MSTFIKTNFDLCTGCGICQLACSMAIVDADAWDVEHENKSKVPDSDFCTTCFTHGYNPRLARLKIINKRENLYHKPVVCNHCENAYCMNVCPAKAYERDKNGYVLINAKKCVRCGICVEYCPENLIYIDPITKKAVKCDMCNGDPTCVKACPTGAIELAVRVNKNKDDDSGEHV
ncbi:4Fe-4S ferredoxin iron-sulfur binding domain protein [Desulfamplus magnetovallimortis]|uniref:4Fe-4S ferredoxin iron-sulfur binding domain protein n=1 Tax=Desulfamplus magnetovallimortis TaxID=1246637 RepID=A0A1W1HIY1_9BACT|nr:4Fe-4S dicluster domain-containing protein [Desulfamplus magnetovallimortis]SLM32439.1 4Fe-4S ferredoxin iron-sulfur binding domain protein [Desulfamplus magnetovallimortis]